ncbi:ABC transporter G family member 32 [Morella rubra]|uniref:ABC transporter G family member 32 n=1 Tax=Morella rubra TaxID=262757 RepID=A0A6A1VKJ2_9ROSI|nr:ABC transporter G family member 32 [Morella rubra]
MLVVMALEGFIISRVQTTFFQCLCALLFTSYVYSFRCYIVTDDILKWWVWGFWISPLMYAQTAASDNEFLGNSWNKRESNNMSSPLGEALLRARGLFPESYWYWIGVGVMMGCTGYVWFRSE